MVCSGFVLTSFLANKTAILQSDLNTTPHGAYFKLEIGMLLVVFAGPEGGRQGFCIHP